MADMFALGVMFYEVIALKHPFAGISLFYFTLISLIIFDFYLFYLNFFIFSIYE
jgi:hypothetical protein